MSRFLPPPTAERIIASALKGDTRAMQELVTWYRAIWSFLGNINSLPWEVVDKAGSKLSDLETREHAMLQEVLGWLSGADTEQVRHISNADGKVWQDHVEVTDGNPHGTDHDMLDAILGTGDRHITEAENAEITALDALAAGMMAKTGNAAYNPRTITGTSGEVEVANGDGGAGNPTIGLPELISTPRKFGAADNNTTFESDGTLVFNGAATVWDDIQFAISSGRTAAANAPDWDTFTANTSEYAFDVDDYIDLGCNEMAHWWKEGSTVQAHLHLTTRAANASGANRFAKFTVWVAYAKVDTVWTETSVTAELTIPNGTAGLYNTKLTLGDLDFTGLTINTQVKARIKRIAATGGTEYADHMFITQFGCHAEKDTAGSRDITTK